MRLTTAAAAGRIVPAKAVTNATTNRVAVESLLILRRSESGIIGRLGPVSVVTKVQARSGGVGASPEAIAGFRNAFNRINFCMPRFFTGTWPLSNVGLAQELAKIPGRL